MHRFRPAPRLILAVAALLCGCGDVRTTLTGRIEGLGADSLRLLAPGDGRDTLAVAPVAADGTFRMEIRLPKPAIAVATADGEPLAPVLLEKGDLRLEYGPTGLCLAAGTPANDSLSRFRELLEHETSPEGARALAERTLERNTDNLCGVWLFRTYIDPETPDARALLKRFPRSLRRTRPLRDAERRIAAAERTAPGSPLVELALPDSAGRTALLSECARERTTVVCFWAAWSRGSQRTRRALQRLAARRPDRAVYAVSLDNDTAAWRRELRLHPTGWTEVLGTDRGRSAAAEAYGIHDVPSHVLIGPDGRILGRGLTPQAIEALLKEPR